MLEPYEVEAFTLKGESLPLEQYRHDADFVEDDTRRIRYKDGRVINQVFYGTTSSGGWYDQD